MKRHHPLPSFAALAAALASPAAFAQYAPAAPAAVAPLSDADALAAEMRVIAARPTDVDALAQAGELSTRLGDLSGAASLFARADKVDPRNGRVKAGMAEVLLRSERPGEALRFFDQAEGYGYPATRFAAERGLAYDLVGQQGRAQRDYRQVLAAGDTPEVRRRYALSLGIAGQGEAALQQLDPLIRRNDRGAWRSRAFILAMQGDVAGATSIATTMMAAGQAQGLAPFFARLGALSPVDRAFAVHFGELRPTAQRLADARMAPALSPLAPEIVQVARAAPVAPAAPVDRRRRRKGEVQLAAAIPLPAPLVRPPAYAAGTQGASAVAPRMVAPAVAPQAVTPPASVAAAPAPRAAGPEVAYYVPGSLMPRYVARPTVAPAVAVPAPAITAGAGGVPVGATLPAARTPAYQAPFAARPPVAAIAATPVPASAPAASLTPGLPSGSAGPGQTVAQVLPAPAPIATRDATVATSQPIATASPTPAVSPRPLTTATASAGQSTPPVASDAVLARIAAALAVPGRELAAPPASRPAVVSFAGNDAPLVVNGELTDAGRAATARHRRSAAPTSAVTPPAAAEPVAEPERPARTGRRRTEEVATETAADQPGARAARRELAATQADEPARPRSRRQRAADRAAARDAAAGTADQAATDAPTPADHSADRPADRRAAARQAAADRKALAEKKAAVAAKALADKEAAEERKAKKAEPERYWVQVAGGANESDLPKAWSAMKAKAPALATHKGWSTPLRATNRVVTGPFKTDEEARAFVNTLKKQGVSAFQFTSEAGQKITRLDAK